MAQWMHATSQLEVLEAKAIVCAGIVWLYHCTVLQHTILHYLRQEAEVCYVWVILLCPPVASSWKVR